MAIRRSSRKRSLDNVPTSFTDLRPYLRDGVDGLRNYFNELSGWLDSNGHNTERLSEVLQVLGVDVSECYRVMLTKES